MVVLRGSRGRACAAGLLTITLAAGALTPTAARAEWSTCRSDPVLLLSNAAVIDLTATVQSPLSDVLSVQYVVHGPRGTWTLSLVNTDGLIGLKETVRYYADNPPGRYDTDTVVFTSQAPVGVTANTTVVSVLGLVLGARSASGSSAQHLYIHVS